jgi:hypothetical protein
MALTELTSDLAIVAALADQPNDDSGLTAAQVKAKFDEAAGIIKTYLNDVLTAELQATTDSSSGADNIGATAITNLTGTTVQALLESIRNNLKATTDSASGADFVAATAISGLTGGTVQALLEALKDYTDTLISNLADTTDSSSGADMIGTTAISGVTGATVQALL